NATVVDGEAPDETRLPRLLESAAQRERSLDPVDRDVGRDTMIARRAVAAELEPLDAAVGDPRVADIDGDLRRRRAGDIEIGRQLELPDLDTVERERLAACLGVDERPAKRSSRPAGGRQPAREPRPEILEVRAVDAPFDVERFAEAAARGETRCSRP